VNSRVFVVALVAALVVLGGGYFLIRRPEIAPVADETPVAGAPASSSAPAVETPAAPVVRASGAPASSGEPKVEEPADAPAAEAAAPTMATLRVSADVAGAQVFLDRTYIGVAPVTIPNVAPGSHRLNVSAEGFEGVLQQLDVQPGPADVSVKLREVRLDVAASVIHRHRAGSCKGQLKATTRGISYETSDKDDAFTASLETVEAFEVDYLKNNLSLKVRGKTYNFSDPDGNANKLFAFHRDVEHARSRIAKGDIPVD
jgi:hypothetical protein